MDVSGKGGSRVLGAAKLEFNTLKYCNMKNINESNHFILCVLPNSGRISEFIVHCTLQHLQCTINSKEVPAETVLEKSIRTLNKKGSVCKGTDS